MKDTTIRVLMVLGTAAITYKALETRKLLTYNTAISDPEAVRSLERSANTQLAIAAGCAALTVWAWKDPHRKLV